MVTTWLCDFLPPYFQFLRATAECFARLSHGLGVCPFVRPSVTLDLYQNCAS